MPSNYKAPLLVAGIMVIFFVLVKTSSWTPSGAVEDVDMSVPEFNEAAQQTMQTAEQDQHQQPTEQVVENANTEVDTEVVTAQVRSAVGEGGVEEDANAILLAHQQKRREQEEERRREREAKLNLQLFGGDEKEENEEDEQQNNEEAKSPQNLKDDEGEPRDTKKSVGNNVQRKKPKPEGSDAVKVTKLKKPSADRVEKKKSPKEKVVGEKPKKEGKEKKDKPPKKTDGASGKDKPAKKPSKILKSSAATKSTTGGDKPQKEKKEDPTANHWYKQKPPPGGWKPEKLKPWTGTPGARKPRVTHPKCPYWFDSQHQDTRIYQQKFNRVVPKTCKLGGDDWKDFSPVEHNICAEDMFTAIKLKPDDYLLDWGTGCGTKLRFAEEYYGAYGLGIDFAPDPVDFAQSVLKHSKACQADGTRLKFLKNETFDHVISFGGLMYIWRGTPEKDTQVLCETLSTLLRLIKPGGYVIAGANRRPYKKVWRQCNKEYLAPRWGDIKLQLISERDFHHNITMGDPPEEVHYEEMYTVIFQRPKN
eukprot:TRINITY_DN21971_c0_g1_i1.p1 TRINITY_DN21971_c0_g1~~TRINITY_DN21971_c0_g1_i1.p1  ORF type:complete len:533 (-),score=87.98 TRINITY_DN21971_c0_g1_i1:526-2124(-)